MAYPFQAVHGARSPADVDQAASKRTERGKTKAPLESVAPLAPTYPSGAPNGANMTQGKGPSHRWGRTDSWKELVRA